MKSNQSKLKLLTMGIALTSTLILSGCGGNGSSNKTPSNSNGNDQNQSNGNIGNDHNQSNDNNQSNGNIGNDHNQSNDNNQSNGNIGNIISNLTSTKQVSDAYIIGKLNKRAIATCKEGTYQSELTVGKKGTLKFDVDFKQKTDCIISLEVNSVKMDINNNGKVDDNDTFLKIALSAPAEAKYVTPLTTLYMQKIGAGATKDELKAFKKLVFDFDPVEAPNIMVKSQGAKQIELQKLMIMMDVLKVVMKANVSLTSLNLTQITTPSNSIDDFDIDSLVVNLPASVKEKAKSKANTIKDIVKLLSSLDSSKIDLSIFMVSISDGSKSIEDALTIAVTDNNLKNDIKNNNISLTNILGSIIKVGGNISTTTIVNSFVSINNTIIIINNNAPKLTLGDSLSLGSKIVDIAKDTTATLTISKDDSLANFYDISLANSQVDKTFNAQNVTLEVKVVDKSDANQYVTLKITGIELSTNDGHSIQTKFVANQTSVQVEEMVSGVKKTYSATLQSDLINSDLSFNIQTIINNLDNNQITSGIDRMNGYLSKTGEYEVTIELKGLDSTELTADFTKVEATVTVH